MNQDRRNYNINLDKELHKRLKAIAVEKEKTLREVVEIALMDWASRFDLERQLEDIPKRGPLNDGRSICRKDSASENLPGNESRGAR